MSRLLCTTLIFCIRCCRNLIWWEDFKVGDQAELGRHTFTEQEIVAFGRQFDPQPFHIDSVQARDTVFGGLIASGWHTCAVGMRLMVEGTIGQSASLGSPGDGEHPLAQAGARRRHAHLPAACVSSRARR